MAPRQYKLDAQADTILAVTPGFSSLATSEGNQFPDTCGTVSNNHHSKRSSDSHGVDVKRGRTTIHIKVSRDKLISNSSFFKALLDGKFIESRQHFNTEDPPIIKLEETNHYAALRLLRMLHGIEYPGDADYKHTYHNMKATLLLAEQWDCLNYLEDKLHRWMQVSLELAFKRDVASETPEDLDSMFRDKLLGFFEMARMVNCDAAAGYIAWYAVHHFDLNKLDIFWPRSDEVDDDDDGTDLLPREWSYETDFGDDKRCQVFMEGVMQQYGMIKRNMFRMLRACFRLALIKSTTSDWSAPSQYGRHVQQHYLSKLEVMGFDFDQDTMEGQIPGSILYLENVIADVIHGSGSESAGYIALDGTECQEDDTRYCDNVTQEKLALILEWRKTSALTFCLNCFNRDSSKAWRKTCTHARQAAEDWI